MIRDDIDRYYFMSIAILLLIPTFASPAALYDDFDAGAFLDQQRWSTQEQTTLVESPGISDYAELTTRIFGIEESGDRASVSVVYEDIAVPPTRPNGVTIFSSGWERFPGL